MELQEMGIVPIIVALVALIRTAGMPKRWLPLTALVLGIAAGFLYVAPDDPVEALRSGIVLGLSAVGAWSGVKNTIRRNENPLQE